MKAYEEEDIFLSRTTLGFTLVGMIIASIVFIFTTFQSKSDAEEQKRNEAQKIDEVNQNVKSLQSDLSDFRKEVMHQFLAEGRKR